ncbi:unnamed protein product, partial [Discosporangium mesarthrocarpum]
MVGGGHGVRSEEAAEVYEEDEEEEVCFGEQLEDPDSDQESTRPDRSRSSAKSLGTAEQVRAHNGRDGNTFYGNRLPNSSAGHQAASNEGSRQ